MASRILLTILLCILILSAGCTALEKNQDTQSLSAVFPGEDAAYERAAAPVPTQAPPDYALKQKGAESVLAGGVDLSPQDQKIIRTADIRLEVPDVQKTAENIATIAESAQGVIQDSSVSAGQSNQYSGTITIRIPSERFEEVLSRVRELGKLTSSTVSADDVTEEYVDLTAQKSALENQLTQYNRILGQAVNVSEILEVQREIERVQVELDRIVGRMKYLDNRISFSTITIRLSEPAQVITSSGNSLASVISEGIAGFTGTVIILVVLFMTLLPLIIIGLVVYFLYRLFRKNKE